MNGGKLTFFSEHRISEGRDMNQGPVENDSNFYQSIEHNFY